MLIRLFGGIIKMVKSERVISNYLLTTTVKYKIYERFKLAMANNDCRQHITLLDFAVVEQSQRLF